MCLWGFWKSDVAQIDLSERIDMFKFEIFYNNQINWWEEKVSTIIQCMIPSMKNVKDNVMIWSWRHLFNKCYNRQ